MLFIECGFLPLCVLYDESSIYCGCQLLIMPISRCLEQYFYRKKLLVNGLLRVAVSQIMIILSG